MALLIASFLFIFLAGSISLFGYFRFVRPTQAAARLGVAAQSGSVRLSGIGDPLHRAAASLQWVGEKIPVSPQQSSLTRRLLMGAGFRNDRAAAIFQGTRVVSCGALLALSFFLRSYINNSVLEAVIIILAALLGYQIPNFVLDMLITRRQRILRLSLPDALDLMVVCTEAGLGLDQAIRVVSRELEFTHKAISEELSLVSLEMRAGTRRAEALTNLAKRTGEPELKKLVAILIQSDRFGTSMGEALRTHSEFMRVRRRQDAEERANKIGVKMIFPIFFLILPSIMLVALGPALLQLQKTLVPLMRDVQFK